MAAPPLEAQRISNPELFHKSLKAAYGAIRQYGPSGDREATERVNRIGYELARHANFDKFPFSFGIVEMPIPNAFALPGGQIFVTRGMLNLDLTDDELAALLGHEIAHVTEQHFLKTQRRATLLNVLTQVLAVGAMVGASQSDDDAYIGPWGYTRDRSNTANLAQGAMAASVVVSELLLRSYSRGFEDRSDELGQQYAAYAGYDPTATGTLFKKMQARIAQTKSYGYWQTHPFFDARVLAAEAREKGLKIQEPKPAEDLRRQTQLTLLGFIDQKKLEPELVDTLKISALNAWPQGEHAEQLRAEQLHRVRDHELEKPEMARDYGRLLELYQEQMDIVADLTPDSGFLRQLGQELGDLRRQAGELYAEAVEVLEGGIYETPFLESFNSNYPESEYRRRVALGLGLAYSRLRRETDAVEQLLVAWSDQEDEQSRQAGLGLHNLVPYLEELAALQQLADQTRDADLQQKAATRLEQLLDDYEELYNGASYLERFPESVHTPRVAARLEELADDLYREMVLFQEVGNNAKAVQRANEILTHAPLTAAADRLSSDQVERELGE